MSASRWVMGFVSAFALCSGAMGAGPEAKMDARDQEALQKTQQMLTNPVLRKEGMNGDKDALRWDSNAQELTGGGQNKEDLYKIASDIFADMTRQSNGDSIKMLEQLELAKKNPEAFYNSLSKVQRDKISELSNRIPAGKQQNSAPPTLK